MNFRYDINGLRAYAVAAVVLFHFFPTSLEGGFAGVDVFFVISGFLMTAIIFKGLNGGSFSLLRFYLSRINRIVPALAVLCLVLLVAGWFLLPPLDYRTLGKHAGASVGFISNVVYLNEAGYFDADSHLKWLLHTWSLSVEWQFYLLYPVVLLAAFKTLGARATRALVPVAAVLGFGYGVYLTENDAESAYFLLSSRAWEMLVGGAAFLYPITLGRMAKRAVEGSGLALIILSVLLIDDSNLWPGALAFFPVIGAFMVLQAQRNDSVFTNNPVCQSLGAWSYSIYLWHWPLVVAIYYFELPAYTSYLALALSVLAGFLSYRFIERFSSKKNLSILGLWRCKPLQLALVAGVVSVAVFLTQGARFHYSDAVWAADSGRLSINSRRYECLKGGKGASAAQCVYDGDDSAPRVAVIGDSHAQSLLPMVHSLHDGKTLDWTMSSCRTISGVFRIRNDQEEHYCGNWVAQLKEKLEPDDTLVILNWLGRIFDNDEPGEYVPGTIGLPMKEYRERMASAYIDTVCELADAHRVIVIEDTPFFERDVPRVMALKRLLDDSSDQVRIPRDEYEAQMAHTRSVYRRAQNRCDITLVSPAKALCNERYCYGESDGHALFFDNNHLSREGAAKLKPLLAPYLGQASATP
ncbi:acyltransferase family protein [Larsenimonas salina]|uniref:acyltransferase family protein n=1 Tax=Larsenimonas salina TaxID=1295565 RepID=UPI0020739404|nr:acyltransferase family protein [Larsenimonas salina]MCM5705709.1 acyltransferase [Larsenimonas salina]